MIESMTGYSSCRVNTDWGELCWEIRSVNNRFLDCKFKLPESLREMEVELHALVKQKIERGRLDCTLNIQFDNEIENAYSVNIPLIESLLKAQKQIAHLVKDTSVMRAYDLMRWNQVLEPKNIPLTKIKPSLKQSLKQTLEMLVNERRSEGQKLEKMILKKIKRLSELHANVKTAADKQGDKTSKKLKALFIENKIEIDPIRLEQELIFYLNKMDIREECDRLSAHIEKFQQSLSSERSVGKSLDFLLQEMNREANTIAAKASDVSVSHCAVDMKVLIEQLREQIQNIQ